jgi:trk system potassium uptake protein
MSLRKLKSAPAGIRVAMVGARGEAFVPDAGDGAAGGGYRDDFRRAAEACGISPGRLQEDGQNRERLRVVIFGGNEYGFTLAQMLRAWIAASASSSAMPVLCAARSPTG